MIFGAQELTHMAAQFTELSAGDCLYIFFVLNLFMPTCQVNVHYPIKDSERCSMQWGVKRAGVTGPTRQPVTLIELCVDSHNIRQELSYPDFCAN